MQSSLSYLNVAVGYAFKIVSKNQENADESTWLLSIIYPSEVDENNWFPYDN